jgi:ABC-2 type transport system permease protein
MTTTLAGVRGYRRLALANTFTKAIDDRLLLTVIAGVAMGLMNFMMGPMYLALEDVLAEMLAQMPEEIMAVAGGVDMATPAGWYTGEMYSIMVPLALMFVAVSSAARAFGGEMEKLTIGLVMSTPTRRTRLAVDKALAMVVHVVLASLIMALGAWIGIIVSGIDVRVGDILAIHLMVTLLAIFTGGVAMIVSIVSGRGNVAILVGMLLAVGMYVWSSFVPLADPIADLVWLSPWHHFIGTDPMTNGVDWASAAWLLILAVVPIVASVYLFKRRDIPA